jgi:hypothetical protein
MSFITEHFKWLTFIINFAPLLGEFGWGVVCHAETGNPPALFVEGCMILIIYNSFWPIPDASTLQVLSWWMFGLLLVQLTQQSCYDHAMLTCL